MNTMKEKFAKAVTETEIEMRRNELLKRAAKPDAKPADQGEGTFRVVNVRDDDTVITIHRFHTFDEADAYRKMLYDAEKNAYESGKPIISQRYFVLDY